MKKQFLVPSPGRSLSHLDFLEFIMAQATRIKALSPTVLTDSDLIKLVVTLLSFTEDFGKAILQVQKDLRTEELVARDKTRDNSAAALKAAVRNASYSTLPEERSAAASLSILLSTYGDINRLPYTTESGAIDKLMADLEGSTYRPMVEKLGITSRVQQLREDNNAFKELFEDRRSDTIADSEAAKAIDLDRMVNQQYILLCDYVLLNARIKNDQQYADALSIINTIRTEYLNKMARTKAKSRKASQSESN